MMELGESQHVQAHPTSKVRRIQERKTEVLQKCVSITFQFSPALSQPTQTHSFLPLCLNVTLTGFYFRLTALVVWLGGPSNTTSPSLGISVMPRDFSVEALDKVMRARESAREHLLEVPCVERAREMMKAPASSRFTHLSPGQNSAEKLRSSSTDGFHSEAKQALAHPTQSHRSACAIQIKATGANLLTHCHLQAICAKMSSLAGWLFFTCIFPPSLPSLSQTACLF